MTQLPQQLINGIWQGAALALFAMGYTLVFGVLNIVNLAHGATFMWGAFFAFLCVTKLNWPLWAAIPVAMVGAGVLAVLIDRLAFKPLRSLTAGGLVLWGAFILLIVGMVGEWAHPVKMGITIVASVLMAVGFVQDYRSIRPLRQREVPHLSPMISSIGATFILVSLAIGAFGAQVSRFPLNLFPAMPYHITKDAVISPIQALVLVLSLILMLVLNLLLKRTQMGRAIRAIAWNERTARLLGINVDFVVAQTFFISGALAGAAGVLLGLAFNRLEPTMGHEVELAGLTVIIVGGMGSIGGAALAAFLVGMIRVLSVAYVDSSFRDAFVFGLLILVLLVRPSGIFGRSKTVRA
ncbi:branched-chain amino acid ABC transporter permease [Desulfomonile tiedjei]|uniref:Amino acid/amide ABC transporter membrane protein 1, HAAT family n=1 Tax=Desulfomonile tiedjei (strain ATCC 49306 / DSM 6799 / DCB-1) TaxID=706587 RepID=I4CEY6_DESTA|nr:branched-chain amino acid ABC transporter permease [Desulfomonile tiedjei]AFM28127.1 amino acid/amide ABC transporter membrane protein 1, HAAT family [Desulfomonile tiedjei DSM 6799]